MLRLVAALTLAALVALVAGDKICCPDGCTEEANHAASQSATPYSLPHTCVLCVLGVELTVVNKYDFRPTETFAFIPTMNPSPQVGASRLPYHPPRDA